MRRAFILIAVLFAATLWALPACAQEVDAPPSTKARLLTMGLSMGLSFILGAIQKRAAKKQVVRNAIPVTNSVVTGGAAGAITGDPASVVAAVVGSLAMSGVYSLNKRIRTGGW